MKKRRVNGRRNSPNKEKKVYFPVMCSFPFPLIHVLLSDAQLENEVSLLRKKTDDSSGLPFSSTLFFLSFSIFFLKCFHTDALTEKMSVVTRRLEEMESETKKRRERYTLATKKLIGFSFFFGRPSSFE